jgi:hypothetical protein
MSKTFDSQATDTARNGQSHYNMNPVEALVHEAITDAYTSAGRPNRNAVDDGNKRSLAVKALDMLQIIPYGIYYQAYVRGRVQSAIGEQDGEAGKLMSHVNNAPLALQEVAGLAANDLLDLGILALNDGKANIYQGYRSGVLPSFVGPHVPKIYLPGVHRDGQIDLAW